MNTNTEISHECGDGCDLGLESFNEFNKLYESRLERIDREANFCDNIKLKNEILEEWIRDLIEQNRCLIETLQELQTESSNRVSLLEYKLKNDEEKFGNNNRFGQLESDLKNVLELLRRAREDREWNATGLTFKTISYEDLFGQKPVSTAVNPHAIPENIPSDSSISNTSIAGDSHFQTAIGTLKELLNEKDTKLNSCLKDNLKLINMNKSLELKLSEMAKNSSQSDKIPEDLRNNGCPGLNRDLNQLQKNHTANKIEYKTSRRNDCKELNKCDKCSEMESLCNKKLDMQQIKYTEIINELSDELNSLSEQLAASQQESLHQEDPMKALEATIVQIEEQNDILQETIQETESRLTNAEYQIGALTFENEQLQLEVHNYRKQLDERQLASNQSQTNKTESDDYHIQISQWRCKVLTLEKALAAKTKDNERLAHQWRDIQQRQTEMQEELYAKKSRVAYLEKEEHRLQESINILSGEIAANKNQHRHRDEDVRRIKIQVEEQTAVILKQRSQNDNLSRENERLRSTRDTLYRDIEAYKSENCNLKGQVSVFQEQENAVQDLLAETQEQLAVEKEEHNRLQGLSATLNKCRANCSRISSNNAELLQKCQMFQTEYENLMCEYQKLLEVKEQALVALNTARQWQSEQDNREKLFAKKLSKNAEHIDTLMADRETLIKKIYDMHRSEVILHNDLDQLRERIQSGSSPNFSGAANNCNVDRYASDSELDYQSNQVYQRAKCVTRKMNRTRKIYQNGLRDVAK